MRIVDPSQVVRPEECHNTKDKAAFRNYDVSFSILDRSSIRELANRLVFLLPVQRDRFLCLGRNGESRKKDVQRDAQTSDL